MQGILINPLQKEVTEIVLNRQTLEKCLNTQTFKKVELGQYVVFLNDNPGAESGIFKFWGFQNPLRGNVIVTKPSHKGFVTIAEILNLVIF
jgi:hypothetical protein